MEEKILVWKISKNYFFCFINFYSILDYVFLILKIVEKMLWFFGVGVKRFKNSKN